MYTPSKTLKKSVIKNNNDKNNPVKIANNLSNSYFDKKEQKGLDWLDNVDVVRMSKEVKQIIRDLVYMNINIDKHGHYFLEHIISNAICVEAEQQYRRNWVIVQALNYYLDTGSKNGVFFHPDYIAVFHESQILVSLYEKILQCMTAIKTTGETFVHLSNLYEYLSRSDGKLFMNNDMSDYVRENFMDNN